MTIKKLICEILILSFLCTLIPSVTYAAEGAVSFEIEAENAVLYGDNVKKVADSTASGGMILNGLKAETDSSKIDGIPVKFEFEVQTADTFNFWIRGKVTSGSTDSLWASTDDNAFRMVTLNQDGKYYWYAYDSLYLEPGKHSFNFAFREPLFSFDKVLITNDTTYLPNGITYSVPDFKPEGRPRVMLSESGLKEVKEKISHPENKKAYDRVVANTKISTKGAFAGSFTNDASAAYIESNAFMYLLTDDETYGNNAVSGLFERYATINHNDNKFRYRSAGYEVYLSAIVYDWCYPVVSEENKKLIYNRVLSDCQEMEIGWPPVKQNGTASSHESEFQIMRDMLSFAIASADEFPVFYNTVMGKVIDEYIPTRNYYYNNTSYHNQGDSYGMYRYTAEMYMTILLSAIGKGELISEKQHMMAYPFITRRRPDGAHMQDGDMFNVPQSGYVEVDSAVFLSGNYYKDPYLRKEAGRIVMDYRNNSDTITPVTYLILNEPDVGVRDFEELPLTHYAGNQQGVMTARTGWSEGISSDTMVVSMKISEHLTRSHQHLDSGNFEIYYKGALALDSGIYNGKPFVDENGNTVTNVESGSSHDVNYHHRTIAHNGMLVYDPDEVPVMGEANDGGQRAVGFPDPLRSFESFSNDEAFDIGKVLAYDYGDDMNKPSYSYLEGDITKAYTDKVKDYSRAFMFLNFFDEVYPGALVVFDRVEAKDSAFKKTWLLHSQEEPEVSGNITTIRRTERGYNGRLINETLLPAEDNRVIEKIGGPGKEYWVDGKNYKAVTDNDFENGDWRIELSPKKQSKSDYFLNVLQVADNSVNPEPLESRYFETDMLIGVQIKDRVCYFGKTKKRTASVLTVKGEDNGNGELIYTVCGLEPGEWSISSVGTKKATAEGGVISFTAQPGEYVLTKISSEAALKNYNITDNVSINETEIPDIRKDGYFFDFSDKAYIKNGDIYVPLNEAVAVLSKDAVVNVNSDGADIISGSEHLSFTIDSDIVSANGVDYKISCPPEVKNDVLYVPLYILSEFLEISCITDEYTGITDLSEGEELPPPYISSEEKVYVSKDGVELAFFGSVENYSELNVVECGVLYSPLPNGVIGGEGTMTFRAEPKNDKKRSGDFGIHIKDGLFRLGTEIYITPYIRYDNKGELKTIYSDRSLYVNRYEYAEKRLGAEAEIIDNLIVSDTNSRTNQYLTQYSPTGEWMQTNLYNGVPMTDSFNGTLKRGLIKIDITNLPEDLEEGEDITLTLTGQCSYIAGHITQYCPSEIKVDVYDFSEYEWDETTVSASSNSVGPGLTEITAKTPVTSFKVGKSEQTAGPWVKKTISIKEAVSNARKNEYSFLTLVILADNSERNTELLTQLKQEDSNKRDELKFVMATKENSDPLKRPYVSVKRKRVISNKLSDIKVNGVSVKDFASDKTNYLYSYITDEIPEVSATAEDANATVSVKQADVSNQTAVISVRDRDNLITRKYTVEFKKERSSSVVNVTSPITADTNSRTNQYSNWYTPDGIYMVTNIYNGAPVNNDSNGTLKRSIIQIDLSELSDIDLSKDIFLNVVGRAQYSGESANPPYQMTVNVYGDYGFNWSEDSVNPSANSVGPSINEVVAMNKIGSFTVNVSQTTFHTRSINIRDYVVKAMALGKEKINIILFADNSERVQYSPGGTGHPERDLLEFQMGTKENTSVQRRPSITYYKYN